MRRCCSILLAGALAAFAWDPRLRVPASGDPSWMRTSGGHRVGRPLGLAWMAGGETAFTALVWVRRTDTAARVAHITFPGSFWSLEASRATREGGDELPDLVPVQAASGNRAWTFPGTYDARGVPGWGYGCWCVNVETSTPLTITVAGTERQVAASNGVMQAFNVLGSAADYAITVAPADLSATYRIGLAANPLVQFYGQNFMPSNVGMTDRDMTGTVQAPSISNEWAMVVARGRVDGMGEVRENVAWLGWQEEEWPTTDLVHGSSRTSFARNGRVEIMAYSTGSDLVRMEVYGFRVYGRWLDEDEIRLQRDLDVREMQARGLTRWRED